MLGRCRCTPRWVRLPRDLSDLTLSRLQSLKALLIDHPKSWFLNHLAAYAQRTRNLHGTHLAVALHQQLSTSEVRYERLLNLWRRYAAKCLVPNPKHGLAFVRALNAQSGRGQLEDGLEAQAANRKQLLIVGVLPQLTTGSRQHDGFSLHHAQGVSEAVSGGTPGPTFWPVQ